MQPGYLTTKLNLHSQHEFSKTMLRSGSGKPDEQRGEVSTTVGNFKSGTSMREDRARFEGLAFPVKFGTRTSTRGKAIESVHAKEKHLTNSMIWGF